MIEKRTRRRRFLTNMLYRHLSKITNNPKLRALLASEEIESGLEIVVKRIVENVMEREAQLGRQLTFEEFRECMMKALNEIAPMTEYIV